MSSVGFEPFLALPARERMAVFEAASARMDTPAAFIEKDFWVCLILDLLYNHRPPGHPRLIFKGGTSLAKAYHLIARFSEDIDIIVDREQLGFSGDRDPTARVPLTRRRRQQLLDELQSACSQYIVNVLWPHLSARLGSICGVELDSDDPTRQTLLINYPALHPPTLTSYVQPRVKVEAGARSGLVPRDMTTVKPYIADDLGADWQLTVHNIDAVTPERTCLEKALILHGTYCGWRDEQRVPRDRDRIARHYFDLATLVDSEAGQRALRDHDLLREVREHNLIAFRQRWKRFDEAIPGKICLVPQPELLSVIQRDYEAMSGMIIGELPQFTFILERISIAEEIINAS